MVARKHNKQDALADNVTFLFIKIEKMIVYRDESY